MACEGIYQMVKHAYYEHGYTRGVIVSNNNSMMKSNLKHSLKEKEEK